ncbi:hypothetical protein D3C87_1617620 [compost metagenome]
MPIMRGSTPAVAYDIMRAMGFRPNSFTSFSDMTITNAAPSEVWEEFPAVTDPPAAKTGFNLFNASTVVSARGPSSWLITVSFVFFLPEAWSKNVSFTVTGTMPSVNQPSFCARSAFW